MTRSRRDPQRGSAMLVTLIVIGALLAGIAVLVSLQMASTRSTDLARSGMSALYCAEAGLAAARKPVADNYAAWSAALDDSKASYPDAPPFEPAFLSAIEHDVDGDGEDDFFIYVLDNDDEQIPLDNDRGIDNDMQVFIVSKCIKYKDTQKELRELVRYNGQAPCIPGQAGGGDGDGNSNGGC